MHTMAAPTPTITTTTTNTTAVATPSMMEEPFPAMRPRSLTSYSRSGMECSAGSAVLKSPHLFYSQLGVDDSASPMMPLTSPRLAGTPPFSAGAPIGVIGQNRPHSRTMDSAHGIASSTDDIQVPPMVRSVTPFDVEWMMQQRGGSPVSAPADSRAGTPLGTDSRAGTPLGGYRTYMNSSLSTGASLSSIWAEQAAARPVSVLLGPVQEEPMEYGSGICRPGSSYAGAVATSPTTESSPKYRPFQRRSRSFGSAADAQQYLKFAAHARAMQSAVQQSSAPPSPTTGQPPTFRPQQQQQQQQPQQQHQQQQLQHQQQSRALARSFGSPHPSPPSSSFHSPQHQQQQHQYQQQSGYHGHNYHAGALHHPSHSPHHLHHGKAPSSMMVKPEKGKIPESVDWKLLDDVPAWLRSLRLHKYTPVFSGPDSKKTPEGKPYTWKEMVYLDNAALENMGVCALGARRKMTKVMHWEDSWIFTGC